MNEELNKEFGELIDDASVESEDLESSAMSDDEIDEIAGGGLTSNSKVDWNTSISGAVYQAKRKASYWIDPSRNQNASGTVDKGTYLYGCMKHNSTSGTIWVSCTHWGDGKDRPTKKKMYLHMSDLNYKGTN